MAMETLQIVIPRSGEPDVLELRRQQVPPPGPGEALVRVEATGAVSADVQMLRGRYFAQPKFPFVPGYDLAGTVEAVGPDAAVRTGQRVAALTRTGAWTERIVLPTANLVPVSDDLDAGAVVALITNGVTAYQMVHRVAKVQSGQTVLVHGAAGGVGTLLVAFALRAGAQVIGTASQAKHDRLRELGAIPMDYRQPRLADRVREITPGGVAAVFDHGTGPGLHESWRSLARGGRLVVYGATSNLHDTGWRFTPFLSTVGKLLWWSLRPGGRRWTFYGLSQNTNFDADLATLLQLLHAGELRPAVAARLPLSQAAKALQMLLDRTVVGKIILHP
jgi:NADPH:quinone reductase-like Zn-dependent oxidoreductase